MEISAPTGGASGYLQSHLASAGRVGRGRRAGGGGSKGRLIHYFQTPSACGTPSPKALMMVMEEGGMLIFLDLSVDPHGLKQPNAY